MGRGVRAAVAAVVVMAIAGHAAARPRVYAVTTVYGSDDCPAGYTTYTGTATAGGGDLVTNNFQDSGSFNGILICSGADLDLYLDRMRSNGNLRNTVASSTSAGCNEEINYSNNRNRWYRWRVSAYSGSASFTLCVDPG